MDIQTLTSVIVEAKGALAERKKLAKLHTSQSNRIHSMEMTRARTTTYNARASDAVVIAKRHEAELKRLVSGM